MGEARLFLAINEKNESDGPDDQRQEERVGIEAHDLSMRAGGRLREPKLGASGYAPEGVVPAFGRPPANAQDSEQIL